MKPLTPETITLAVSIADSITRSDIECHCRPTHNTYPWWWNTKDTHPDDRRIVAEAVTYLEARGLLDRKPDAPHLVALMSEQEAGG